MNESLILNEQRHRPWAALARPWAMVQVWRDLLFAHWNVPAETLRSFVPPQLTLDTFGGEAWVSVAPFHMSLRMRGLPILPGMARILELNCRTYVTAEGKPGIFFFSLDTASRAAVWGARTFYHLPYFPAEMRVDQHGRGIRYSSRRVRGDANFDGKYEPISEARQANPGTIEHWLTERYCLYTVWRGAAYRGEIHHSPWALQNASASIEENSVASAAGIALDGKHPAMTAFVKELKVLIWTLERVKGQ